MSINVYTSIHGIDGCEFQASAVRCNEKKHYSVTINLGRGAINLFFNDEESLSSFCKRFSITKIGELKELV